MDELFPQGLLPYALGGGLIGAGIGLIYLLTGHIAGISSYFTAVHSWWSRRGFFRQPTSLDDRVWKSVLIAGLIIGAGVWTLTIGDAFTTEVQWWRLLLGGFFVGLGTRLARGCTSGHGICGVSAIAAPSIVSTVVFMLVAILTANVIALLGVTP